MQLYTRIINVSNPVNVVFNLYCFTFSFIFIFSFVCLSLGDEIKFIKCGQTNANARAGFLVDECESS